MIYLDSASTTAVDKELTKVINMYLYEFYGNAGSPHKFGRTCRNVIEEARNQISHAVNVNSDGVIFTSCGSEANTLAIVGLANHLQSLNLNHIITTKYEHHSVLNAMKEMERYGFEVTYLDVNNGVVSCDELNEAIRDNTGLVSIMCVNNEIGSVNNIQQIYAFCKNRRILFHSDCVQAFGTVPIDMEAMADMITLSGHKIHAPKGIGCLCVKNKQLLSNIIYGGEQEFGLRPGTENVANIVAFGSMAQYAVENREQIFTHIEQVSMCFGARLMKLCDENHIVYHFNSPHFRNTPKILSVRFDDVEAETLMMLLDANGVCVSAGSACSSHSTKPSHVLKAIGLTDEEARSTIRISFSDYNTVEEVERAAEIIVQCILQLQHMREE